MRPGLDLEREAEGQHDRALQQVVQLMQDQPHRFVQCARRLRDRGKSRGRKVIDGKRKKATTQSGAGTNASKAKKAALSSPPVLDLELVGSAATFHGRQVRAGEGNITDFSKPFVLRGADGVAQWVSADEDLKKFINEFMDLFESSTERVTDGRAALSVKPSSSSDLVLDKCEGLFGGDGVLFNLDKHAGADKDRWAVLEKTLYPQVYGIAVGNTSPAKFEIGELGCLRFGYKGCRMVSMASARDIAAFVNTASAADTADQPQPTMTSTAAPGWFSNATQDDLQAFQERGYELWSATLNPTDILFTPACFVVAHRIFGKDDVFGIKVGLLSPADILALPFSIEGMKQIGKVLKASTQALEFEKQVMKWAAAAELRQEAADAAPAAEPALGGSSNDHVGGAAADSKETGAGGDAQSAGAGAPAEAEGADNVEEASGEATAAGGAGADREKADGNVDTAAAERSDTIVAKEAELLAEQMEIASGGAAVDGDGNTLGDSACAKIAPGSVASGNSGGEEAALAAQASAEHEATEKLRQAATATAASEVAHVDSPEVPAPAAAKQPPIVPTKLPPAPPAPPQKIGKGRGRGAGAGRGASSVAKT